MTGRLEGLVAVVTGGANGIGEAIVRSFVREGAYVAAADIDVVLAERVAREAAAASPGASAVGIEVDVTRSTSVDALVTHVLARWGRLDILVNSAGGFGRLAGIADIADEEWDRVVALNFSSVFRCARAAAVPMVRQRSGRIINIASQAGVTPNPYASSYVPYGAAKAGVIGMTKLLAKELGPHGITVNAISPGTTATARVQAVRDAASLQAIAAQNPLRTLVEPEDSAEAAVYLASVAGRHVTGINLNVNAGSVMT